jgi:hypothetical protein
MLSASDKARFEVSLIMQVVVSLASRERRVAKRFFGVPEFHYYALADGIAALLTRMNVCCPLCLPAQVNIALTRQRIFSFL